MKVGSDYAGRMAELVTKAGRQDKDTDVVLGAGFRYIKDKKNRNGEMVAKFSGGSNITLFQRLRNALSGKRYLATENDIKNILKSAGMNETQIRQAMHKIRVFGDGFSAVDVKKQINKFQFENTTSNVKNLIAEQKNA